MSDANSMNNAAETPSTTAENCLSILEIKMRYKKLNQNLVEAMERIDDIISRKCFDQNDRKFLNNRDCSFVQYELNQSDIDIYGEDLMYNLMVMLFDDAIFKSQTFFNSQNSSDWSLQIYYFKKEILIIDEDTRDLIKTLNILHESMNEIFRLLDLENMEEIGFDEIEEAENIEVIEEMFYSNRFNFLIIYENAEKKPDLIAKRNYYYNAIAEKKMLCLKLGHNYETHKAYLDFSNKCLNAINIIDELIRNTNQPEINISIPINSTAENTEVKEVESTAKNPEFTTNRQVLALYYMLHTLDKATHSIDRTVKARFIQFLTNKNEDNIYKILADPFKGFNNKTNKKTIIKDLEYIKTHFEALGLKNIVNQITAEMKED